MTTPSMPSATLAGLCAVALWVPVLLVAWRQASPRAWVTAFPAALGAAVAGSVLLMLMLSQGPSSRLSLAMLPLICAGLIGWTWPLASLREAKRSPTALSGAVPGSERVGASPARGRPISGGHRAGA